jgi:hypothetical protein
MIKWLSDPEEKILSWRRFRKDIADLTAEQAAERIAQAWAGCPSVKRYHLTEAVDAWPDPWTLISNKSFDNLARALGMYYTAVMCEQFNPEACSVQVYQNTIGERLDIALLNQGKYVLNFNRGQVVNIYSIPDHFTLIQEFQPNFKI